MFFLVEESSRAGAASEDGMDEEGPLEAADALQPGGGVRGAPENGAAAPRP